ncbi:MAG TPA: histidine kinase [Halanaerobiales bacterium]|nr:histidine kinase [Halanaerobiales bacterium]
MKIIKKIKDIQWNSIKIKVSLILIILILPLVSFLFYNSYYSIDVIQNQVAHSNKNLLSLYMQQVDTILEEVDKYLIRLAAFNIDFTIIQDFKNLDEYHLAITRLTNKINEDILAYSNLSSIFIYTHNKDLIEVYNNNSSYKERWDIREYIKNLANDNLVLDHLPPDWYQKKINNHYYLFRIMRFGDIYLGAWLNIEKLQVPLNLIKLGEKGASFFVTSNGIPMTKSDLIKETGIDIRFDFNDYYIAGEKNKYLIVKKESEKGDFSLMVLIPTEKILENLPYLKNITNIIIITILLLIPVSLWLLRRYIISPLGKIMRVMERVKTEGDLSERVDQKGLIIREFQIINSTFNNMMDTIQKLRIDVYEEKLAQKRFELQNLQLQVKPHFFLNTLNIIYSLSRTKKFDKIQEMIQLLVQYFRYMFKSSTDMVLLKDEVKHVENYIRIQQIRFPDSLNYKIEVCEDLLDIPVPPLIIQTFVENIIKHAVTLDDEIYFEVRIEKLEKVDKVAIIIRDNGEGFSAEQLLRLNSEENYNDDSGKHIGIYNVKQRLDLLYDGNASILFANDNNTGGAVVKMIIPIKKIGG